MSGRARTAGTRRPWIGITSYHREVEGRARFTLPAAYADAVRRAGGRPVVLCPGDEEPADLLERLDGLLLSGGGDLDPQSFGGGEHEQIYFVCGERDAFELALVREALRIGLPLLAICRGMQVLNVALGGGIHLHLPDVVGERVHHRISQDEPTSHGVAVDGGSRLAGVIDRDELPEVASWHHQAVDRLGEGLTAVARAEDGTVEALELAGAPQVLAVQWHPELRLETPSERRLFDWLVRGAPAG
ncbi:MAG: gamma-glutamyl-gamma-aminobutyrate hydrolase family protein [Myxococcota bacterium]|nr:gamma-glutamyl-gamma-aminobutyrate hydrolase family protein [Myxococcota bacterium]